MNIALADDLATDRFWLSEKLHAYMTSHHLQYKLFSFPTGEALMQDFAPGKFDIIFLDIYLPGISGMEAARKIREQDLDCKLIFLTCSEEHFREGYTVNACHYLVKPVRDEDFEQALKFCRIRPQYAVPYLDVISEKQHLHLDTSRILYICIQNRVVQIHTLDGTIPATGTFGRITAPLLTDKRFLLSIQGVLVNMDMIIDQKDSSFLMKNGTSVHINLRNRRSIIQAYRSYIFETMHTVSPERN